MKITETEYLLSLLELSIQDSEILIKGREKDFPSIVDRIERLREEKLNIIRAITNRNLKSQNRLN